MQRVRIGLTGLACVFLLVVLAAAFLGLAREKAEVGDAPAPTVEAADNAAAEQPKDPLAELGVAPGNVPEDPALNSPAPTPPPAP